MTEEVLVTIKGMQMMPEDQDEVEIVTSGKYLKKGNKHYITYEEVVEGMEGTIQNLIKLDENGYKCKTVSYNSLSCIIVLLSHKYCCPWCSS